MSVNKSIVIAQFVLAAAVMTSTEPAARDFSVSVNTEPLEGQSGFVALDFTNGDGVTGNSVNISGLATNASLGPLQLSGDASGNLDSGPLVLADGAFFSAALQSVEFGTTLDFQLSMTTEIPMAPTPDSFSFFLLDADQAPFAASDPTGADALFVVDITGPDAEPEVFLSEFAVVSIDGQFEIAEVRADPDNLWPPNGKMVPVTLTVEVASGELPDSACEIAAVDSNEPPVDNDFEITGPLSLELRAQRLGEGDGRVYTIEVACTGAAGDGSATAEVRVPHDQRS